MLTFKARPVPTREQSLPWIIVIYSKVTISQKQKNMSLTHAVAGERLLNTVDLSPGIPFINLHEIYKAALFDQSSKRKIHPDEQRNHSAETKQVSFSLYVNNTLKMLVSAWIECRNKMATQHTNRMWISEGGHSALKRWHSAEVASIIESPAKALALA